MGTADYVEAVIGEGQFRRDKAEHLPQASVAERRNPAVLEEVERDLIARAFEGHASRTAAAARELGIHRSTLWRKMKRYGIATR